MGYLGNCAISHSPNRFFLRDKNCSHSVGPSERFGTHKKLSGGYKVGLINRRPITSCRLFALRYFAFLSFAWDYFEKDDITKAATRKDEKQARKDERKKKKKTLCEKTPFKTAILSSLSVACFVFSPDVISSFRLALFSFSFFFAWRLFVFSLGVVSSVRLALFHLFARRLFVWRYFVFRSGVFLSSFRACCFVFSRGVCFRFQVSRLYLGFDSDSKHFIITSEQNIVK